MAKTANKKINGKSTLKRITNNICKIKLSFALIILKSLNEENKWITGQ